jgi:hypothetical protein
MAAALSLISMFAGTAFAYAADRMPKDRAMLERAGGICLITGLSVLGGALRFFC